MTTYGLFHDGNACFAAGRYEDIEIFVSMDRAKDAFWDRYSKHDSRFPDCDELCEMWTWASMPEDDGDLCPNMIIKHDRTNGGVKVVRT